MTKQRSRIPTGIMIGRLSYTNDRAERIELAMRGERAALEAKEEPKCAEAWQTPS